MTTQDKMEGISRELGKLGAKYELIRKLSSELNVTFPPGLGDRDMVKSYNNMEVHLIAELKKRKEISNG